MDSNPPPLISSNKSLPTTTSNVHIWFEEEVISKNDVSTVFKENNGNKYNYVSEP